MTKNQNDKIKITLSSDIAQIDRKNRHVVINNIMVNGVEKNVNYQIMDTYDFSDIILDSLPKGTYKLNGVLRYYLDFGKHEIPFEESFTVK